MILCSPFDDWTLDLDGIIPQPVCVCTNASNSHRRLVTSVHRRLKIEHVQHLRCIVRVRPTDESEVDCQFMHVLDTPIWRMPALPSISATNAISRVRSIWVNCFSRATLGVFTSPRKRNRRDSGDSASMKRRSSFSSEGPSGRIVTFVPSARASIHVSATDCEPEGGGVVGALLSLVMICSNP